MRLLLGAAPEHVSARCSDFHAMRSDAQSGSWMGLVRVPSARRTDLITHLFNQVKLGSKRAISHAVMKRRRRTPRRRRISNPLLQNTVPNFRSRRQIHHTGRRVFVGMGDYFDLGCTRKIRWRRRTFHPVVAKTSRVTQNEDDLEAAVAKHTSKL